MSVDTPPNSEVSISHLLTGIVADAQDLGLKHLELFRSELLEEIRKTTEILMSMAVGLAVMEIGGLLLGHMLALLLSQLVPSMPIWACYAVMGVVVAGCGAVPLIVGVTRLRALYNTTTNEIARLK